MSVHLLLMNGYLCPMKLLLLLVLLYLHEYGWNYWGRWHNGNIRFCFGNRGGWILQYLLAVEVNNLHYRVALSIVRRCRLSGALFLFHKWRLRIGWFNSAKL